MTKKTDCNKLISLADKNISVHLDCQIIHTMRIKLTKENMCEIRDKYNGDIDLWLNSSTHIIQQNKVIARIVHPLRIVTKQQENI